LDQLINEMNMCNFYDICYRNLIKFRNTMKLSQDLSNLWTIRPLGFYTNF